jgi:ferredoxin
MSTYRVEIDRSLCSGFGSCVRLAPEIVQLDRAGVAELRVGETDDPAALDAAASCPMGAIAVFESVTGRQAA